MEVEAGAAEVKAAEAAAKAAAGAAMGDRHGDLRATHTAVGGHNWK